MQDFSGTMLEQNQRSGFSMPQFGTVCTPTLELHSCGLDTTIILSPSECKFYSSALLLTQLPYFRTQLQTPVGGFGSITTKHVLLLPDCSIDAFGIFYGILVQCGVGASERMHKLCLENIENIFGVFELAVRYEYAALARSIDVVLSLNVTDCTVAVVTDFISRLTTDLAVPRGYTLKQTQRALVRHARLYPIPSDLTLPGVCSTILNTFPGAYGMRTKMLRRTRSDDRSSSTRVVRHDLVRRVSHPPIPVKDSSKLAELPAIVRVGPMRYSTKWLLYRDWLSFCILVNLETRHPDAADPDTAVFYVCYRLQKFVGGKYEIRFETNLPCTDTEDMSVHLVCEKESTATNSTGSIEIVRDLRPICASLRSYQHILDEWDRGDARMAVQCTHTDMQM